MMQGRREKRIKKINGKKNDSAKRDIDSKLTLTCDFVW